jgi:hypothetical protein
MGGHPENPLHPNIVNWLYEVIEEADLRGDHDVSIEARALLYEGRLLRKRPVAEGNIEFLPEPENVSEREQENKSDYKEVDEIGRAVQHIRSKQDMARDGLNIVKKAMANNFLLLLLAQQTFETMVESVPEPLQTGNEESFVA